MNYAYRCKFCGKEGIATCQDDYVVMFTIEKWLKMICCNRCGKFMEQKRKVQELIVNNCVTLDRCRMTMEEKNAKLVEEKTKERLMVITKQFCTLACDHYGIQNVWDMSFVDMLIDRPHNANIAIFTYLKGVAHIAKTS